MYVSEQASEKVVLADHQPGASTFPGRPWRGGWIPILLKVDDAKRPVVFDWICPACYSLLVGSRTCPKCGLPFQASPKKREPIPKRMHHFQYKKWAQELFYAEDEDNRSRSVDRRGSRKAPSHHHHASRSPLRRNHCRVR